MPEITIKHDANERVIGLGNDSVEASRQAGLAVAAANAASASAAFAESMTGPTYASTAAGLAATTDGQGFAVDNGGGTVTVYLNDAGAAVEQRTLATTAALASTDAGKGAALVGYGDTTAKAALDRVYRVNTVADFTATRVPAAVNVVSTLGYYAAGDRGAARYKRAASEPAHNLKAESLDGAWWEIAEDWPTVEQAGGGTAIADNGPAIQDIIDFHPARKEGPLLSEGPWVWWGAFPILFAEAGEYTHSTRIDVPKSKNAVFYNAISGAAKLRWTGADHVGVRFEPRGPRGTIGFDGVDYEGGDIAVIGGSNGDIRFTRHKLSHGKLQGMWFTDALFYHDAQYPAKAVAGFSATNPMRITVPDHGRTSGDLIGLRDCTGEERINGSYYVTVIDAHTLDCYTNSARTVGFNGVGFVPAAFIDGLMTTGFPLANPLVTGINTVWCTADDLTVTSMAGHGMTIESSTYLLFKGARQRFGFNDRTPLVVDGFGVSFDDIEFQCLKKDNCDTDAFIHARCRLNSVSHLVINGVRFGPEKIDDIVGGDYATGISYSAPTRHICFGPLDGTPARLSAVNVRLRDLHAFGQNHVGEADTICVIDENASVSTLEVDSGYINNIKTGNFIVKETAKAAGRAVGVRKEIGRTVATEAFTGSWFSGDGAGWTNQAEALPQIRGAAVSTLTLAARAGLGSGTVTAGAADNVRMFTLTFTPTGSPSATSPIPVADATLPGSFIKVPKAFISANNANAGELGRWYATWSGSTTARKITIFSSAPLVAGTVYSVNILIEVCE